MRQRTWFLTLAALASVLAGCSGSGRGLAGGSAGGSAGPPPCRAGTLTLGYGPQVSPMTEEHADWYRLTNRGPSACLLDGYPAVTLYSASGTRLRFRYISNSRSQFMTSARPHAVLVRPGASAWLLVAKNACVLRSDRQATRIGITLPGQPHAPVKGQLTGPGGGLNLDHCQNPRDPGQYVAVSPFEPTRQATLPVQAQ